MRPDAVHVFIGNLPGSYLTSENRNDISGYGAQDNGVNYYNWRLRYRIDTGVTPNRLIREVVDHNNAVVATSTRVLTNDVNAAAPSFTYDTTNKTVRCRLEVALTGASAQQLPGGTMSSGNAPPLETTVRLRN